MHNQNDEWFFLCSKMISKKKYIINILKTPELYFNQTNQTDQNTIIWILKSKNPFDA